MKHSRFTDEQIRPKKGILVSDGNDFRAGELGRNAIRVSLGGETSNDRLIEGLGLLREYLG